MKFFLAGSVLLNITVLATVGSVYYSHSSHWIPPFGGGVERGGFLFERLSLQPAQLKMLRERALAFREDVEKKRQDVIRQRKELLSLLRIDGQDTKERERLINAISVTQKEIQGMVVQHILDNKAVLDQEQQKRLFDLIESAMARGTQAGCLMPEKN
jgi:Spy/CpxP family protein refolding chaperone